MCSVVVLLILKFVKMNATTFNSLIDKRKNISRANPSSVASVWARNDLILQLFQVFKTALPRRHKLLDISCLTHCHTLSCSLDLKIAWQLWPKLSIPKMRCSEQVQYNAMVSAWLYQRHCHHYIISDFVQRMEFFLENRVELRALVWKLIAFGGFVLDFGLSRDIYTSDYYRKQGRGKRQCGIW